MAGQGPPPTSRKATGRNVKAARNAQPSLVIRYEPSEQPPLPDEYDWPQRTRDWWDMWGNSALSATFSSNDWDFLLDTALLHAAAWGDGNMTAMSELRLRVAKFGATPEDRARLRIQFADADEKDHRAAGRSPTSKDDDGQPEDARSRYGNVTTVEFGEKSG